MKITDAILYGEKIKEVLHILQNELELETEYDEQLVTATIAGLKDVLNRQLQLNIPTGGE